MASLAEETKKDPEPTQTLSLMAAEVPLAALEEWLSGPHWERAQHRTL